MHPLNVFNNPKLPLKYPSNWIRIIRMNLRNLKYAYQRVTRGVADCDYWDLDTYFLEVFVQGLDLLIKKQHGYPGNEQFPTPDSWDKYLQEMRDYFYKANENNHYYPTPKENIWWHGVEAGEEDPDAVKDMCDEAISNSERRQKDLEKGLEMMKSVFFSLWD